ncbi:hypothetical protein, partial [Gaetbulibacter aestuarii]
MHKTTFTNLLKLSLLFIILMQSVIAYAQLPVPFTPRLSGGSIKVKGDIVLIGNNIITAKDLPLPYNGTAINNNQEGAYVNVASGGDASIFSSSSADLEINNSCKKILYAGLYWASVYPLEVATNKSVQFEGTPRLEDWNQIKFKLPTGGFIDLVADNNPDPAGEEDDIIFDGYKYYGPDVTDSFKDSPIICYKNVTNLLQGLADADGIYTVANQRATRGYRRGGCSAGWTLVVIYESPLLPSKFISLFDGYAGVQNTTQLDIPVSGFQTLPAPLPVNANIGVAALEGDYGITGDSYQFKANSSASYTVLSDAINQANNFFNSTITRNGSHITNRNPASLNTLGLDVNDVKIPNPNNIVLPNDETAGDLKLTTSGDGYGVYLTSFSVEIIEPDIKLTKIVEDASGNDISNQYVNLGDELNYVIGFQNVGNDDAKNLLIRDVLPINVEFNYPDDIALLPAGVSVQSYDPLTRELIFQVDDSVVEQNDPVSEIRFKVNVVRSCSLLSDACSNTISNQAYVSYNGTINSEYSITDDPSFSSNTGCLLTPAATNFLADLDCTFEEDVVLCGASVTLTAGNGYDSYSWSTDPSGSPVVGTDQSLTVTQTGTYYVHNTAVAPCQSIDQTFNVITYGANVTNPLIPFADQVVICPNDGKQLPNFYLCGLNDTRFIQTGINDTTSIIWERLDETSCSAVPNQNCANESDTCTWNEVQTGPDYVIDTKGQYRITLNYSGGCFNQFYFNVYSNLLEPTATAKDIICTTPGEITVNNVPTGYEYSLDGTNYQSSNVFSITTPGIYTASVRQVGVSPNPCIFTVPDIQVRSRNFTVSNIITQPYCNGDLGSIYLAANDASPQYYFSISKGGTIVNSVGPITDNHYNFYNLSSGIYTFTVSTEDGCSYSEDIEIINPPVLTATAALTKPLTCSDGEITVYPEGGTPPFFYFVNSTTEFQTEAVIPVTSSGVYNITVVDSNNCSADTSISVDATLPPEYSISQTDILCASEPNSGSISFNVQNAHGNTLTFSIDNGTTFSANPVFSNLTAGTYQTVVQYNFDGTACLSTVEDIIITEPARALTASGGVYELAGCGPSGEGKLRITNPQGGTPPYEYSFDNQSTWTTSNEAYVPPGTYTLYVRDANGCIYPMSDIVLDQEPPTPSISISDPDFNCDGTAQSTVTVINEGGSLYTYNYLLDGVPNTNTADPKTFLNVPQGSHTITVEYTLQDVPTYSNLLIEDFGSGAPTTTSGIASAYCFNDQRVDSPYPCGSRLLKDNQYSVASFFWRPDDPDAQNTGAWYHFKDHTTNGADPDGRYLIVNIGSAAGPYGILYSKPINDVIPFQDIKVQLYLANMLTSHTNKTPPDFLIQLVDPSDNVIAEKFTGKIDNNEKWNLNELTLNPGNNTDLTFVIRSGSILYNGNDAGIDDIRVFQLPVTCTTSVDFPFIVDSGKAFTAGITNTSDVTCSGAEDGTITIAAQNFDPAKGFQYSIDNGTTWNTQMTSPHTITGLGSGNYSISVRYEDAPDTCSFNFNSVISEPALLSVSATGGPVTCLNGATIQASASGGTQAFSFELLDTNLNLIFNFPGNGILTNISEGDYIIRVTDANGCTATTNLSLTPSTPLTATIDTNSDFCYDASNGSTLIVNASGGQAPYEYSNNGGAFGSSNTFSNLAPGTYDIVVRDAYGCTYNVPTQTIKDQLIVSVNITKGLDCSATPEATISGTISGGTAPFSYQVSYNGAGYGSSTSFSGNTFSYSTSANGDYEFLITDAAGCTTESSVQTLNPISLPEITSVVQTQFISCHGDSGAAIQVNINNSVGTPTYQINVYNLTTSTDYGSQTSGLPAGDYQITLTDSNACTDTANITITEPDPIILNFHVDPIQCTGGGISLGRIYVDAVSGGTPNYTYHVTGVNGYNNQITNQTGNTQVFDVVNYGYYQIIITDANGCSVMEQNVLVASPPDSLDILVDTVADCTNGGTALVSIGSSLSGDGPFHFAIYDGSGNMTYAAPTTAPWQDEDSAGSENATFTGLIPGATYTFIVYAENTQCYYYQPADVPIPTNSTLNISNQVASNITCKGSADGTVSFDVGSSYGSSVNVTYTIYNAESVTTTGISGTGTISSGGNLSVSNLGPLDFGRYFILVEEDSGPNTGCSVASSTFNITESAIELNISATVEKNANCNPNSGVIFAQGENGTPPYMYQVTTSATSPSISDPAWTSSNTFSLDANNYYVHVKDAFNCIKTTSVINLPLDPEPVISATLVNQCVADEGQFEISVDLISAGIPPYVYSIDGGAFQTRSAPFIISNLASGNHSVEVRDANGCGNVVNVSIIPPLFMTPSINIQPSCSDNDGEITVDGYGGTGNYAFSISPNPGSISLSGNVFSGVPSGTYTITITDTTTSCTSNAVITLNQATPVTFTTTPSDVSCFGGSDGSITVNLPASNDDPIYTYSLDGGLTTQTSNVFTGLSAGTYNVTVTSGKNCSLTQSEIVGEPNNISVSAPIVTSYACTPNTNASNYASITVSGVTGGSGNYTKYEFIKDGTIVQSGNNNTYTESDYSGGNYTINVYDDYGCLGSATATIQPFIRLDSLDISIDNAITCSNDEDISVIVNSTVGTPSNLEYTLEDAASVIPSVTNTTGVFTGLPVGNYIITVVNLDTGCSLQTTHYVSDPNTFDLSVDAVVDVTCFSDADGSVNVTLIDRSPQPTDDSGPFDYIVNDSSGNLITSGTSANAGPITISGLASGTYTISATLTNTPFCNVSKNFTISAPIAPLSISETHSDITCINGYNDGTISASASGGWSSSYEYQLELTNGTVIASYSSNYYFESLSAGDYIVSARDTKGCVATVAITLSIPPPITATVTANTTILACFGDTDAVITISGVSGGQGSNYSYILHQTAPTVSSSGPQASPVFSGLGAGTYSVEVIDGYNCSYNSPDIIITQPTQIQ